MKCRFCENECGIEEIDTVKFSLGIAGEMQVELYIHCYNHYGENVSELSVGVSAVEGDTVVSHNTPISYCPFCGRNLAREHEKGAAA